MISLIQPHGRFRTLTLETFDETTRLGERTIAYGHNGSGKTSLAEILLSLKNGDCPIDVNITDDQGNVTNVKAYSEWKGSPTSIFTRSWVDENLGEFMNGNGASSIVTFGAEATNLEAQIRELEVEKQKKQDDVEDLEPLVKKDARAVDTIVKNVQNSIEGSLRDVDNRTYTKNNFNKPKIRRMLEIANQVYASEEENTKNLEALSEGRMEPVRSSNLESVDLSQLYAEAAEVTALTVESEIIGELANNAELQGWVKMGLSLHAGSDHCLFCEGELAESRMRTLRRHFDESRKLVEERAQRLIRRIDKFHGDISYWRDQLPSASQIYIELREKFSSAKETSKSEANVALSWLEEVRDVLTQKEINPELGSLVVPKTAVGLQLGAPLSPIIDTHNKIVETDEKRKKGLAKSVLEYLIGSTSEGYQNLKREQEKNERALRDARKELERIDTQVEALRAQRFSSAEMAQAITRDLAQVYGRSFLKIELTDEGKSYICRREGSDSHNLSDGERLTLALVYFLRSLEDERDGIDPRDRIVVIDDPSSSLDRESLFATHSWLLESLVKYGQVIILTHDFEMLRLFKNSQKNQLSKQMGLITAGRKPDATPEQIEKARSLTRFPKVCFLEVSCGYFPGSLRVSRLRNMPHPVISHLTEYHYVFERVVSAAESREVSEDIFLIPNAVRRMLESFTAFKVPEDPDFLNRLERLTKTGRNGEFRDLYDFCNRYSHGEGREITMPLDSRPVTSGVRRSLEFIKAVDPDHYRSMLRAIGHRQCDPLDL